MDGTNDGGITRETAELIAVRQQREMLANGHAQEAAARMMLQSELSSAKKKIEQLEASLAAALAASEISALKAA